ncbi:MAG: fatty acid oxidation complex subunit alpha FadJ, partial [Acidobacteria bacterium]|nr:fatty acid oxidation complex subunit alpha FadJ [Acidobacteriota bacterium]
QSRALRWIFFATNEAKKQAHPVPPRPVNRLGVLGAGFMGSGIASVSLGLCPVVVRDISDDALAAAARAVESGLTKQVRSGAIRRIEADRRRSRLHLTLDMEEIAGADLVIEAVFEDLALKKKVLAQAEEILDPEAVLATNTSALPIARIAEDARHPERILGMHYFSPVPKMPLLEIVVAELTSPEALATARAFGVAQGKTPIAVKDGPGFYTTRILAPYLNEAMLLLEEGAAIEELDRAMRDFGFPVGPMALLDEVGIDVGAHVALDLGRVYADRGLGASKVLPLLHETGYRGRKNGRGFYIYPPKGSKKRKEPNPEIYRILGVTPVRGISPDAIRDRLALVMVNEAAHCLDEGVIASPRDGDLGAVLGLGFPPFRAGPFHHVDAVGAAAITDHLRRLAEDHGTRFEPAPVLLELAKTGGRFHP